MTEKETEVILVKTIKALQINTEIVSHMADRIKSLEDRVYDLENGIKVNEK